MIKTITSCRRTMVAMYAITLLAGLAAYLKLDLSGSIAMVSIALAGANSAESIFTKKKPNET